MKIIVDYDETLYFNQTKTFNKKLINYLNKLSWKIIIYTARRWDSYDEIKENLINAGLKFETIVCWKPLWDIYIDDKAININNLDYKKDIWKQLQ